MLDRNRSDRSRRDDPQTCVGLFVVRNPFPAVREPSGCRAGRLPDLSRESPGRRLRQSVRFCFAWAAAAIDPCTGAAPATSQIGSSRNEHRAANGRREPRRKSAPCSCARTADLRRRPRHIDEHDHCRRHRRIAARAGGARVLALALDAVEGVPVLRRQDGPHGARLPALFPAGLTRTIGVCRCRAI